MIEAPRKLVQIERQISLADVMVTADDAALQQRPERFDVIRVDLAAHVLTVAMANRFMRASETRVGGIFIGRDKRNLIASDATNEAIQGTRIGITDDAADHVALALNCSDDARLEIAFARTSIPLLCALFVPMAVTIFAANIRFVSLDYAHQLWEVIIFEHRTNAMADVEGGLVGGRPATLFEHPLNLQSRDAFLGLTDQIDDLEPYRQRIVSVLEDRPDQWREAIAGFLCALANMASLFIKSLRTALTDPVPRTMLDPDYPLASTSRAFDTVRPSQTDQQFHALVLSFVLFVNLSKANHKRTLHHLTQRCQVRFDITITTKFVAFHPADLGTIPLWLTSMNVQRDRRMLAVFATYQ